MHRITYLSVILLLAWTAALATTAGQSDAQTRYFYVSEANLEYIGPGALRRPTFQERVSEINNRWHFMLQCYRAVDGNRALRARFADHPSYQGSYALDHHDLRHFFNGRGVSTEVISAQPTTVYTLQLVAYRKQHSLRTFIDGLSAHQAYPTALAQIYSKTPKDFHLGYGDESLLYKADPLYIITHEDFTRVRYGIYATPTDAARDAAIWRKRFHVEPSVLRVPFTRTLTRNIIWGDVPGVYKNERH